MDRLSSYAADPTSMQFALLNLMLAIHLICKGISYVTSVMFRRNPPTKLIRSKLARSDGS